MNKTQIVAAIVVVLAICAAGGAFLLMNNGSPTFSIEYELNGGTNSPDNPTSYAKGSEIHLKDPTRDGMEFTGWYLDAGLSRPFESITKNTTGNLMLYAGWEKIKEVCSVSYVLNGGTNSPDNPTSYKEGTETKLFKPTKSGVEFLGWYLDAGLSKSCNVITDDIRGDITLYAKWGHTKVGTGIEMKVTGQMIQSGVSFSLDGTMRLTYHAYNWVSDSHYSVNETKITYTSLGGSFSNTFRDGSWSGDSDMVWEVHGTDTLDTVKGKVDCTIIRGTESGSTDVQYQWIGNEDLNLYRLEMHSHKIGSDALIVYEYVKDITFDAETEVSVTVYAEGGLNVAGEGTYNPGDTVTLTVEGDDFKGWYNTDGELLSAERTYSLTVSDEEVVIYAKTTKTPTTTYPVNEKVTLPTPEGAVLEWNLLDSNGKDVEEFEVTGGSYTFTTVGDYILLAKTDKGGVMWNIIVNGTVNVTYEWKYDGITPMSYTMSIDYDDIKEYWDRYSPEERRMDSSNNHARDMTFITPDDPYLKALAQYLRQQAIEMNLDQVEQVELVMDFTQSVGYVLDIDSVGYTEYWKFPLETLYDHEGDCEDTAMLCATLLKIMGYDTALVLFDDHMACAVAVNGTSKPSYTVDGQEYIYCETTSDEYDLGEIPPKYAVQDALVLVIK